MIVHCYFIIISISQLISNKELKYINALRFYLFGTIVEIVFCIGTLWAILGDFQDQNQNAQ